MLDTEIEYLKSPVLNENEESRLEDPPHTDYKDSIRNHCIRAIKSSLRFGEHNLLLLGGGDWNDGLDQLRALKAKAKAWLCPCFVMMLL